MSSAQRESLVCTATGSSPLGEEAETTQKEQEHCLHQVPPEKGHPLAGVDHVGLKSGSKCLCVLSRDEQTSGHSTGAPGKPPRGSRHLVCSLVPHHICPRRRAGVGKGRTAATPAGAIPARSFHAGRAEAVVLYIPSPPCSLTLQPLSAMKL